MFFVLFEKEYANFKRLKREVDNQMADYTVAAITYVMTGNCFCNSCTTLNVIKDEIKTVT